MLQPKHGKAARGASLSRLKRMGSKLASKTRKAIVERFSAVELPPTQIDVRIKRDPTKVRVLPTDGCSWVSTPASASP